jgi:hypothetical protein
VKAPKGQPRTVARCPRPLSSFGDPIAADKAYGKGSVEAFFRADRASGFGEDTSEPSPTPGNASAGSASAHADG